MARGIDKGDVSCWQSPRGADNGDSCGFLGRRKIRRTWRLMTSEAFRFHSDQSYQQCRCALGSWTGGQEDGENDALIKLESWGAIVDN